MTDLRKTVCFLAALLACPAFVGCGEDGKGIGDGDHCPEQTLYKYEFLDAGAGGSSGHWEIRKPDGSKFKPDELNQLQAALKEATTGVSGRCLTPAGTALTLDGG